MARLHNVQVEPEPHPDAILYTPNAWGEDGNDAVHGALGHVRELMEERLAQVSGDNEVYEARSAAADDSAAGDSASDDGDSIDGASNESTAITIVDVNPDANADPPPQATDKVAIQTLRGNRRTDPDRPPRRIIVLRTRFEPRGRRATDPPGE